MDFYLLLTLMGIHIMVLAVPGPDILLVLRTSLAFGYKSSVLASLGIGLGIVAWVFLAAFGLKAVFIALPPLQGVIMGLSAIYLMFLAFMLFKSAKNPKNLSLQTADLSGKKRRFFIIGLFTNLSNPKAVLYFASVFALFLDKTSSLAEISLLVAVISIESMLFFLAIGRLFSTKKAREIFFNNQSLLDSVCAVIFAGFSLAIAYECVLKFTE